MADSTTITRPTEKTKEETRFAPLYNLILLDDDDHSYEYVIYMLMQLFGFKVTKAFKCAIEVDTGGRVILMSGTKEHLELKQEQIHSFGPDPSIPRCAGSMSAIIEAAPSP
ncbi:MAG: ATP-dependent Clp protease adaptor ClpS [Planctomycetota bacterium]|nr:ATP-dependent Clp protease adaptor ClpS [Planctomycetota bacterium]